MATIMLTLDDDIAKNMERQSPDIYLDVFGGVRIRSGERYTHLVGEWWKVGE